MVDIVEETTLIILCEQCIEVEPMLVMNKHVPVEVVMLSLHLYGVKMLMFERYEVIWVEVLEPKNQRLESSSCSPQMRFTDPC